MLCFLIGVVVGAVAVGIVFFFVWKNNKAKVEAALEIAATKFK